MDKVGREGGTDMKKVTMEVKNQKTKADKSKSTRVAAYCRVSTLMEEQELSYDVIQQIIWRRFCQFIWRQIQVLIV